MGKELEEGHCGLQETRDGDSEATQERKVDRGSWPKSHEIKMGHQQEQIKAPEIRRLRPAVPPIRVSPLFTLACPPYRP